MPARPDPDHYTRLGISETATEDEITRAYRRAARRLHPDTNAAADTGTFADTAAAYQVIGDRLRRSAYDASRRGWAMGPAGTTVPDGRTGTGFGPEHFDDTFHRGPSRPGEAVLVLSLEEAVLGATRVVEVERVGPCPACAGGGAGAERRACRPCGGTGYLARRSGSITIRHRCAPCDGSGRIEPPPCDTCEGTGATVTVVPVTVRVPPGVDQGSRLRVPLPDTGAAGSTMLLTVDIEPHPSFTRSGRDLRLRVPLTVAEAALGATLRVPTIDGAGVSVRIPPGTGHGRTLRVRGRGVAGPNGTGDLLLSVDVEIPSALSDEQRAALEGFAAVTPSPRPEWWERPGAG